MKAIILDYEGVIIDSSKLYETKSKKVAEIFKEPWTKEFMDLWKNYYIKLTEGKMSLGEYYEKLSTLLGKKVTGAEDAEFMKGEHLRDKDLPTHLIELKRKVGPKIKFAIFGNYVYRWVDHLLIQHNLNRHFQLILTSDKIGMRKPDPAAFEEIANHLGVPASECIYVGHSEAHLNGAKEAGMKALYLGELNNTAENYPHIATLTDIAKFV